MTLEKPEPPLSKDGYVRRRWQIPGPHEFMVGFMSWWG